MKMSIIAGFTVLAAILAVQAQGLAQGPGRFRGMAGPGGFMTAAYLGLTPEQQSQAKSLRQSEWATEKPLLQQLATYRQQLRQLTQSATPLNPAQLQALAGQIAQTQAQLTVSHAQADWQFFNTVLTPDQQAKLVQLQQQMEQMRKNHQHPPQGSGSNQ